MVDSKRAVLSGENKGNFEQKFKIVGWLAVLVFCTMHSFNVLGAGSKESRFSDEVFPYLTDDELPQRTPPILELGDAFLGVGNLKPGFVIPTGAVWQPRFWVYGTARSSLHSYDRGSGGTVTEWSNRLDLFGNLQLTGTERLLIGITPLHQDNEFSGHVFEPDSRDGFEDALNMRLRTFFVEGDIAELFPRWDVLDSTSNDIGFSLGRQGIVFQDGMLINDTLDAFGLTRNNVRFQGIPWLISLRTTALFGWDEIHRDNNRHDTNAYLMGLFTSIDTIKSTFNFDIAYVDSSDELEDDLIVFGFDAIQRIGLFSTTFRLLGSHATQGETRTSNDGLLLFGDVNWTPAYTYDVAYVTGFVGIDDYTSAARDPLVGGPLGRTGLLFSGRGIGSFPSPLSNRAGDSYGGAVGYQMQTIGRRWQAIFEAGGRKDNSDGGFDSGGVAARFQKALGRRTVLSLEAFGTVQEARKPGHGLRTEFLIKL